MPLVRSFPPVAGPDARILILGSMPGRRSLDANEYYAHPQNAFWRITGSALGFDPAGPYDERCRALILARVALWDVLRACERESSLDSDIIAATMIPNNIHRFLADHRGVRQILFNGTTAETVFRRHVLPTLPDAARAIRRLRLPSTSPAHAGMRYNEKRKAWGEGLRPGRNGP